MKHRVKGENTMLDPLWLWGILGVLLLGVEMLTGTFYILWFGIASLCVSLLLFVFPHTPFALQLLSFSLLSLASLVVWKFRYAQQSLRSRVGQSRGDAIGRVGRVIEAVSAQRMGRIVFTIPVMGSREWTAVSDETLEAGVYAEVVAIEGNYLRVKGVEK
ncbi:MAG: NfeD family protein [Methylophilaceae bacterium]|nr:NfeD family protein [Methylophilaceae bacterium]